MIEPTIAVRYRCRCMNGKETVLRLAARRPGEDVLAFMARVNDVISKDHDERLCSATAVEYLKIPMEGNGRVGLDPDPENGETQ